MRFKNYAKVLSMLYLLTMFLMLFPFGITAYEAKAYEPLEVEIPYKHVYTTTNTNVDSVFHYIITAKDGAPLPAEAAKTGSFSINGVSGTGKKEGNNTTFSLNGTLIFTFAKPGVYVYEIKSDLETDRQKTNANRYTFEPDTKTITVYIANAPGNSMKLQMFTVEDSRQVKQNEIKLDPSYKESVLVPTSTTTPSATNTSTPETTNKSTPKTTSVSTNEKKSAPESETTSVSNSDSFKTGDASAIWQYAALAGMFVSGIIILLTKKKGREDDA